MRYFYFTLLGAILASLLQSTCGVRIAVGRDVNDVSPSEPKLEYFNALHSGFPSPVAEEPEPENGLRPQGPIVIGRQLENVVQALRYRYPDPSTTPRPNSPAARAMLPADRPSAYARPRPLAPPHPSIPIYPNAPIVIPRLRPRPQPQPQPQPQPNLAGQIVQSFNDVGQLAPYDAYGPIPTPQLQSGQLQPQYQPFSASQLQPVQLQAAQYQPIPAGQNIQLQQLSLSQSQPISPPPQQLQPIRHQLQPLATNNNYITGNQAPAFNYNSIEDINDQLVKQQQKDFQLQLDQQSQDFMVDHINEQTRDFIATGGVIQQEPPQVFYQQQSGAPAHSQVSIRRPGKVTLPSHPSSIQDILHQQTVIHEQQQPSPLFQQHRPISGVSYSNTYHVSYTH